MKDRGLGSDGRSDAAPAHIGPLAAALVAVFIGALDLTVIATIMPRMIFDLNVNTADVDRYIWIVNGYLLAYVVAIPVMGRVSDVIGRQAVFQLALGVFLIGSVWCAVADGMNSLIIGRVIQGAGGGAMLPVTMALVGDLLPPQRRLAALGLVGAVETLGWVLGPIWGAAVVGVLAQQVEPWRWVFWVNIPLGVAASIAIASYGRRLPRLARGKGLRQLDVIGTLLLASALLFLNLGLSSGGEVGGTPEGGMRALGGTRNPLADYLVPMLVGAIVVGALFVWWERRVTTPILPLTLFRIPRFSAAMGANFVVGSALIVAMVDVPIVVALLVESDRVSTVSALMLAPFTLLMAAFSFVGGIVAGRIGVRGAAMAGLGLVVAGYVALYVGLRDQDFVGMVPGLAIAGAGFGLVIAPIGGTAIGAARAADRGIAAALTLVFRLLGMTIGISAFTAIGVRRLQALTSRFDPIVQMPDESTAEFLERQRQFLEDHAIPLSILVVRETFLIAAGLAVIGLLPVFLMRGGPPDTRATSDAPAQPAADKRAPKRTGMIALR